MAATTWRDPVGCGFFAESKETNAILVHPYDQRGLVPTGRHRVEPERRRDCCGWEGSVACSHGHLVGEYASTCAGDRFLAFSSTNVVLESCTAPTRRPVWIGPVHSAEGLALLWCEQLSLDWHVATDERWIQDLAMLGVPPVVYWNHVEVAVRFGIDAVGIQALFAAKGWLMMLRNGDAGDIHWPPESAGPGLSR